MTAVYFVVACGCRRWMKIGLADEVEPRLADLQNACPMPLRLAASLRFPTRFDAQQAESCLHAMFRQDRVRPKARRCEWVNITPPLRDLLRAIKRGENVLPTIYEGGAAHDLSGRRRDLFKWKASQLRRAA